MDNLTHSLVGALIGQAGFKRKTGLAMPALIIGANIPDIDATCIVYGTESLAMRRGITHGPIAWLLLPLILAGLLWWFDHWQAKRGTRPEGRLPVHFGWLYALAFIACLTHPALDWLNNYGIRLLEPFSSRWFYGDTLFIIDVWLWALLGFATWVSLRWERAGKANGRTAAIAGLSGAVAYILANIGLSAFVADYARMVPPYPVAKVFVANPVPFAPWRRELLFGDANNWKRRSWSIGPEFGPIEDIATTRCAWPDVEKLAFGRPELAAFLFWSRAPFVERHPNGDGIVFQDARFYSVGGRAPFMVEFPDVECREPKAH